MTDTAATPAATRENWRPVPGARLVTPSTRLTEDLRANLVTLGGFTHPLFAGRSATADQRSPFQARPFPGQALLLILGGLVEQTTVFDDLAIAMIGYDNIRFRTPAYPGDTVHAELEVWRREPTRRPDRVILVLDCSGQGDDGPPKVTYTMNMLCHVRDGDA